LRPGGFLEERSFDLAGLALLGWVDTKGMKEIIGMALFVASLFAGSNYAVRKVYDIVREATLRKVAKGLPPLPRFTR